MISLDKLTQRCQTFLKERAEVDPAHDEGHVLRVVMWAERLAEEEGADLRIVMPAAWLHDCVTVPKDSEERPKASALAAAVASAWLAKQAYPEELIPDVAHAIEAHSFSAEVSPRTLEARVVQDADRLDALGSVGIARTYSVAGSMGSQLFHPDNPVPVFSDRELDDARYATDHFYTKLFAIAESMNTASARFEAQRRVDLMRRFLSDLARELQCW